MTASRHSDYRAVPRSPRFDPDHDAGVRVRYWLLKATTWTMRLLTLAVVVVIVLTVVSAL